MINFIGDGGHAKVCRELIASRIRTENARKELFWFVAIGDNAIRREEAIAQGAGPFARLIHRRTHIAASAAIGEGSVIMAGAIVQTGARIGRHCIVNTSASVDHDCVLEDYVHIAPGAHLCGGVHVGEGALIGVGVGIEPGTIIPAWSIVKRTPYAISLPGHQTA